MNSFLVNEVNDIGGRPERSERVGFGKPLLFNTIYIYIFISIYIFVHGFKISVKVPSAPYLIGLPTLRTFSERPNKTDDKLNRTDERPNKTDERLNKTDVKGRIKPMAQKISIFTSNIKTLLTSNFCVLLSWNKKRGVGRTPKIFNISEVSIYEF